MRIGFYINSLALLRGDERSPEPAMVAAMAEAAGAQPILFGCPSAPKWITERDMSLLRELVQGDLLAVAPTDHKLIEFIIKLQPEGVILVSAGWEEQRTVVPVRPDKDADVISGIASAYRNAGLAVSLFIPPTASLIKDSSRCGVTGVVLDGAQYAQATTDSQAQETLDQIADAAMAADKFELMTAVAHNLSYQNIGPVAALPYVDELYIGRAVVGRSIVTGMDRAVEELINVVHRYRAER